MRRKKKTTIFTFESRERTTIHRGARHVMGWCERCEADVLMVTPNEAATLAGTDALIIFRGVESGEIHFAEIANGVLLICSKSLARSADFLNRER